MNSATLLEKYKTTRSNTLFICKSLETEDYSVQPMLDVSPPKWHLAHTTWFFEQFVLGEFDKSYVVFDEDFSYLFNSYYNHAGDRVLRANRGLMTRPSVEKIVDYRNYVDSHIADLLEKPLSKELFEVIQIGLNHEEQHQELLHYDIKYILGHQVLMPNYHLPLLPKKETQTQEWISINEGVYEIGHSNNSFCFDNELPIHKVYLHNVQVSNKLVTQGEFLEFIEAGGYERFEFWHAEGWDFIQNNNINAPMYWHQVEGKWHQYSHDGLQPIDPEIPITHISYYEAFAYASWSGNRLPTEFEWEIAAQNIDYGKLWEWTSSAYLPYPGFSTAPGALGEYNGKFMVNQNVLRGSSFATPKEHSRITYRNFFHASCRWQFSGIRLAK